ncbi:MAG: transglutaminase domain-containing protein [Pirellulaceae bacterium]|nr:transglutaminase domain-containing protein [Pirellulaceae bacterium]
MKNLLMLMLMTCPLAAQEQATPATDAAVASVRQQMDYLGGSRAGLSRDYITAVATMNHVQSELSSLRYAVLSKAGKPVPGTVEECFRLQAGICGNHIDAFLEIARRLEIRARPVEFYLHGETPRENHNHICVEVFYRESWRLLDVTWGTVFRRPGGAVDELASIEEIRKDPRSRRWAVTNQTDLWYQQWKASGLDPLEYVDYRELDILRGRAGTIRLAARLTDAGQQYQPVHQPGYLGRNDASEDYGAIRLSLLRVDPETQGFRIQVSGVAGTGALVVADQSGGESSVSLDQLRQAREATLDLAGLEVGETLDVQVRPGVAGGVGYVVYSQITLVPR